METTAGYQLESIETSDKSRGVALALAVLLGPFGGHRFYVGKTGLVGSGSFRDAQGRLVRRWDPEEALPGGPMPAEVLEELDQLRQQVAELAERVDFAERLLASPRPPQDAVRPSVPS